MEDQDPGGSSDLPPPSQNKISWFTAIRPLYRTAFSLSLPIRSA